MQTLYRKVLCIAKYYKYFLKTLFLARIGIIYFFGKVASSQKPTDFVQKRTLGLYDCVVAGLATDAFIQFVIDSIRIAK